MDSFLTQVFGESTDISCESVLLTIITWASRHLENGELGHKQLSELKEFLNHFEAISRHSFQVDSPEDSPYVFRCHDRCIH